MKKSMRVFLGIASITIGIGIIAIIIGIALGGARQVEASEATMSLKDTVTNITSLEFDIRYGEVTVLEGNEFKVEVTDMLEEDITSEVVNGVWKIKSKEMKSGFKIFNLEIPFISFGKNKGMGYNYNPKIIITIPKNTSFDKVVISLGAGNFISDVLNGDNITLEVGAGEMEIRNLTSKVSMNVDVGAGEMRIDEAMVNDITLNVGVGKIYFNGLITGDCSADCGVGSIKMDLLNFEENCYYVIDCGIGSVIINNNKYAGHKDGKLGNSSATNHFDLQCGIGEIVVRNK